MMSSLLTNVNLWKRNLHLLKKNVSLCVTFGPNKSKKKII